MSDFLQWIDAGRPRAMLGLWHRALARNLLALHPVRKDPMFPAVSADR